MPIKVLIVDDSATVRQLITKMLSADSEIQVVGTAADPYVARDKILELNPDVITLDIEMPRMDGITFLKILMEQHPCPVIVISSLTQAGSAVALEALRVGAVDIIAKPSGSFSMADVGAQLIDKIKAAAQAKLTQRRAASAPPVVKEGETFPAQPRSIAVPKAVAKIPAVKKYHPRTTLLMGASTGGTEALRQILTHMPADIPPTFIVQHIPPNFSKAFAERLNALCPFDVKEAEEGDVGRPGLVIIAPGDYHMTLHWTGSSYRVSLKQGPLVWHQRPAVDVLFDSAVHEGAAPHATAVVLTGMGRDGADGLLKLKQAGASTLAQDEASSVVYGMPKACAEIGAAMKILPLNDMHRQLPLTYNRHQVS